MADLPAPDSKAHMLRADVIGGFLKLHDNPTYLEIGVDTGVTFHALETRRKVAVDPHFKFAHAPSTEAVIYHEVPSDEYFGEHIAVGERFHVIYVDGLHTFEQTLRDLLNATEYLTDNGVIVVDDVVPSSFSASLPDLSDVLFVRSVMPSEQDMSYMGDVYKLVFFVQTFMQSWSYATIAENHGQLVMWRQNRREVPERTVEAVGRMDLVSMFRSYDGFNRKPLADIVQDYRVARGL